MPGNIGDWPKLKSLEQFSHDIALFTKFNDRFYFITKDDRVFALGDHKVNHPRASLLDPNTPYEIPGLFRKNIVKFSFTDSEVLALSSDGRVWALKLWIDDGVQHFNALQVDELSDVVDIFSNSIGHFALTRFGRVFRCEKYQFVNPSDSQYTSKIECLFHDVGKASRGDFYNHIVQEQSMNPEMILLVQQPVTVIPTYPTSYILHKDGYIKQYSKADGLNVFYNGSIQFKELYIGQQSNSSYLIGRAADDRLYALQKVEGEVEPRLLPTEDIVHAFATDHPNGSLPFMVSLGVRQPYERTLKATNMLPGMFNNSKTSDAEFRIEGKPILVHRAVLSTSSNYMFAKFRGPWKSKSTITIRKYSYRVYQLYLRFLYTDRLSCSKNEALDLYALASNNKEDALKEAAINIFWPKNIYSPEELATN